LAKADIVSYHDKENYPSHTGAVAAVIVVIGGFIAYGTYSLIQLWNQYGQDILDAIQTSGLPDFLTANIYTIGGIFGALIVLSLLLAVGASALANRLGGTLIYLGAVFMNVITWLAPVALLMASGFNFGILASSWPVMLPGLFTLFMTILLFTVYRDRVRRAGEIIKLTGRVCLDEKGVFIPPLVTMFFTLISALMFGAIIFQFTPLDVLIGNAEWTLETAAPVGIGVVLYLFTTIFFYNFAYGTSSAMVYIYMRGRDPALGDGVKSTLGVIGGIAALSVASVVVVIVRFALQRLGREVGGAGGAAVGRAAGGVIGWIWAMINYFTIPAMVAEQTGAKDGIKRSAGLVRRNFVDVIIKETAVRWGFGVLSAVFFIAFAVGGAAIGWFYSGDLITTLIFAVVFIVFAAIPSSLVLRTFDIVYVTLLYVFIRRQEGEVTGKTAIPSAMERELKSAYNTAQRRGNE
jgi:hypothetical protein